MASIFLAIILCGFPPILKIFQDGGVFEGNVETIENLVKQNKTYKQIDAFLSQTFPEVKRGFSESYLESLLAKLTKLLALVQKPKSRKNINQKTI